MSHNSIQKAFDNYALNIVPSFIQLQNGKKVAIKLLPNVSSFEHFIQKITQRLFYLCYNIWIADKNNFGGADVNGADFAEWFMVNNIPERVIELIKHEYGNDIFLKFKDLDGYEVNDLTYYLNKLKTLGIDLEKPFAVLQGYYSIIGGVIRMIERLAEFNDIPIYNETKMQEIKQIKTKVMAKFEVIEKALPENIVKEIRKLNTEIAEISDIGSQIKIRLKGKLNAGEIRFYPKENLNKLLQLNAT